MHQLKASGGNAAAVNKNQFRRESGHQQTTCSQRVIFFGL